jgi:4'-phosphopantetheinyl transferase
VDLAATPENVAATRRCLTPAERAYATRGSNAVQNRRVLLRAELRRALGEVLGLPAADVPLVAPPGRPALTGDLGDVDASCSASGQVGVVAVVRDARVGVDVERTSDAPLADVTAEGWLTPGEVASVAALPRWRQGVALARCWTQKEAVLKGLGSGLLVDPRTVDTAAARNGFGRVGDWELSPVAVPGEYVASVAIARRRPSPVPVGTR